jgi:UDP-N-acetylmuramoyl-tripeptide--D-alanyl-D-alanine ligase
MRAMSLREIVTACGGSFFGNESKLNLEVSGVAIDSRKIEEGYLFIPMKGARVDGHTFIPQVMAAGALCTLSEQPVDGYDYILVSSTEQALKDLAEHYRKALDIKVVGITGSVGKTSTKEMIASVLSQKYQVLKTAGNFNNEIGLPLTIFNIREEHQIAVLEMGISDFGEMSRLAKMARPDICVITNIGLCHLENLGDRDGILKAKTEMFAYRQAGAKVILNGEDDKLLTVKEWEGISPQYFGLSTENDAYATDIHSLSLKGTTCTLHLGEDEVQVMIPIPGHHMVYNALAGALVGKELGLTLEEIKAGVEALVPVSGRNNLIETKELWIIDDCYNANPVSMKSAIDLLMIAEGRKTIILGDMFELGADELALHREVGQYAALARLDRMIFIGNMAKEMYDGATKLRAVPEYYPDKAAFFEAHNKQDFIGMTVLVKASHGMHFEEIVEWLV